MTDLVKSGIALEDVHRRAMQTLALAIQYARAEALADHAGTSGFERDAMETLKSMLLDVHRDIEAMWAFIDTATDELRKAGTR